MTDERIYGHTRSGRPITDTEVRALSAEAEAGFDVDALVMRRAKRGSPALRSAPATVESVRLDPELRAELLQRARSEGTTTSEIIREGGGPGGTLTCTNNDRSFVGDAHLPILDLLPPQPVVLRFLGS